MIIKARPKKAKPRKTLRARSRRKIPKLPAPHQSDELALRELYQRGACERAWRRWLRVALACYLLGPLSMIVLFVAGLLPLVPWVVYCGPASVLLCIGFQSFRRSDTAEKQGPVHGEIVLEQVETDKFAMRRAAIAKDRRKTSAVVRATRIRIRIPSMRR